MVEYKDKIGNISSEFQSLSTYIKNKKDIGTAKVEKQIGDLEFEKDINISHKTRCSFVYKNPHTYFTEGIKREKGDRCPNPAISKPENKYCRYHKYSSQAIKDKKEIEAAKRAYKEYYDNPENDLTLLYDDVYFDKTNTIVQKNSDPLSNTKWIIICKSKVDIDGNRILHRLNKNAIDTLNNEKEKYNYNYIINPDLFRDTVKEYSEYKDIQTPPNQSVSKICKQHIIQFPNIIIDDTYEKMSERLMQSDFHMPYKELINESEYEERLYSN